MNAAKRAVAWGRWCVPALALTLLCVAGAARAQDQEPTQLGHWSLRAGAFFPMQGEMRDQAGKIWWAVGVDYNPRFSHNILDGDVFFSADLFTRSAGGTTVLTAPLLANITWNITPPGSAFRVYGGIGAGAYVVSPLFLDGTVQPGVRFILGADVTERFFLQLNYDWVSGFTDDVGTSIRTDGLSAMVGVHL